MNNLPEVTIWGTGSPRREFLHVDDLASAAVFLMKHYDEPMPVNVGVGEDLSIAELAELIQSIVGYTGKLTFDPTKPDGRSIYPLAKVREELAKLHAPRRASVQ